MRRVSLLLACALTVALLDSPSSVPGVRAEPDGKGPYPSDWFGAQRAFPYGEIPQERFHAAVDEALIQKAPAGFETEAATLEWTPAGPYNIGGRVTALAVAPGGTTVYLGAANGGVFKSVNSGVNWTPIMDGNWVYSIGALALDPTNSSRLIVGTGEANSAIDTYDGRGVFQTTDGGLTWGPLGLAATARIGRVAIDPSNPQRLFVAAMGKQFSTGPDRGLYRSENGGFSWTKVLFVNDSTGVCDVIINPAHPETVYCASWERIRRPSYRRVFGPGCGVWRSTNSGTTWTRLDGTGLPAPSNTVGRIGLAFAPSRPSWIYAQIIHSAGNGLGLYRSTNGGASWTRRDADPDFADTFYGFGWYFGDVAVSPTNPDVVYCLGGELARSIDGGVNFDYVTGEILHVDQHALWIDPSNPSRLYAGNDGGFFWSTDNAVNWAQTMDLPITQFYAGAIDPSNPARLLGGTQDNNTLLTTGSPSGWDWILGGDGFQCLVDPTNPNIVFAEWQYCSNRTGPQRSTNGGVSFSAPAGINAADRFNWNSPIVMDPGNHNILLTGSQRVYKSTDNGLNYAPISGDLTTNPIGATLVYGTLTTLEISAADPNTYYAGTDDGRVWRSTNAGGAWTNISAGLPVRWVTRVTADPADPAGVYVTLSGFSQDERDSHVYRSTNRGTTWASISANLPDIPANDLVVDPLDPQTLFIATDVGVYASRNRGQSWFPLARGIPMQTIFDLTLHSPSRTLVAATHGRSQWKLDLSPLPTAVETVRPTVLRLAPTAPNPSRAGIETSLEVSAASRVEVSIYDAAGRRIKALIDRTLEPGRHPISWDGTDERRVRRPGVFFLRAITRDGDAVRRITLLD